MTELKGHTDKDYQDYEDRLLSFKELSREKSLHYPRALSAAQVQLQVWYGSKLPEAASTAVLTVPSMPQDAKSGFFPFSRPRLMLSVRVYHVVNQYCNPHSLTKPNNNKTSNSD